MPTLASMPPLQIEQDSLARFGDAWNKNAGRLSRTPPFSSGELGRLFDSAVATALCAMLGNIPIHFQTTDALLPPFPNCVEIGDIRVVGGVRPQNFDVGYRPDGIRFAFDSKTLNDRKSVNKNWQNMINDLATEATTVHSRFPHAVVALMVIIPEPCLSSVRLKAIVETLERLGRRTSVDGPAYMSEAISLVLWNPNDGSISTDVPDPSSPLRLEKFPTLIETAYTNRYKGLPPHTE